MQMAKGAESKRRVDLDIMKTIGIVFVVMFHVTSSITVMPLDSAAGFVTYLLMAVFGCQVGIFFFVNGALLLTRQFSLKRHLKKTVNLFVLTIAWGCLFLAMQQFGWIGGGPLTWKEALRSLWDLQYPCNLLWYFGCLIVVWLFMPIVRVLFDCERRTFFYFWLIVIGFSFGVTLLGDLADTLQFLLTGNVGATFQIDPLQRVNPFRGIQGSALGLGYFMTGGLCMRYERQLSRYVSKPIAISVILLCVLLRFAFGNMMSYSQGVYYQLSSRGYYSIVSLIEIVMLFRLLCPCQKSRKIISLLGETTGGIYLIHWPLLLATKALFLLPPSTFSGLGIDLLVALALLVLSFLLTRAIRRLPAISWFVRV